MVATRILLRHRGYNLLSISAQDVEDSTALHMAVLARKSQAVRILLDAGADPTVRNAGCFTPILEAAKIGFYV